MPRREVFAFVSILLCSIMIGSFFTFAVSVDNGIAINPYSIPGSTESPTHNANLSSNLSYIETGLSSASNTSINGTTWQSMRDTVLNKLNSLHIPSSAKLPPNYDINPNSICGLLYTPSYTSAPAPMGIASYGVSNASGSMKSEDYSTRSFQATLTMDSANEIYMDGDAIHTFSIQFNAVLNNVTLFGQTGYQFWTQNVVDYSTSTHQLTFIDNIWNFSSPTAVIQGNEIHSGNGTVVPGVYYYDIGPTFTVNFPFTLHLYLNTTNIGGYNTVFFNYTIINTTSSRNMMRNGSFDMVQFNSTGGNPAISVPMANFAVNGNKLTDTGYIPMDAELILGGAGGGSNAEFLNINATMAMSYIPIHGSQYRSIPSAYDVGSASGETSTGISEYYSGNVAYLNTGPSLIQGMWNISNNPGYGTVSGMLSPSNGFMFVNEGEVVSNVSSQWSPTGLNGSFNIQLSPGVYSIQYMMSYHSALYKSDITVSRGNTDNVGVVNLAKNSSMGLYTPLYASDNAQLKNLSSGGSGTPSDPYIITGPGYNTSLGQASNNKLNPLFSQVDDYLYPVFSGIMVSDTTSNSVYEGFSGNNGGPAFLVNYNISLLKQLVESFGEDSTNYLQMIFYNDSNIVVTNNTISGWFSSVTYLNYTTYNIPPVANLMLWNTTQSLLENNHIMSQGSGILIYNNNARDTGNYVWNNTFSNYNLISPGSLFGYAPIGIIIASSGNTVYNNIFDTTIPVVSLAGIGGNIYTGQNVTYHNCFNITKQSASNRKTVNGFTLSGSAVGSAYQGGNYYYNYFGNGNQKYNGSGVGLAFNKQGIFNGSINYAYDQAPLTLYGYRVTVNDTGLPIGISGYFDINNGIYPTSPAGTEIYLPNGTYSLQGIGLISSEVEYSPVLLQGALENPTGDFVIQGPTINMTIQYTELFNVTVKEAGLPSGTLWGFSIPDIGEGFLSVKNNISFYIAPGAYQILPQNAYGYSATSIPQFVVTSPDEIVNINYTYSNELVNSYSVTFSESGLPSGHKWTVKFNGADYSSTSSSIEILNVTNGNYSYSIVGISGYNHVPGGIVNVNFSRDSINVVFQKTSAIPLLAYVYIAIGTAGGIVAGSVTVFYRMRKV